MILYSSWLNILKSHVGNISQNDALKYQTIIWTPFVLGFWKHHCSHYYLYWMFYIHFAMQQESN